MNEYDDKRRKLALKSKLEQLERETWLLDTLLRALQIGRPHQIDALLTLIRSNPPKQDIRAYLEHGFGSPDDAINVEEAPSADPVNGFMPSLRIHRHRSMRVTDVMNPPISVPARPWTTVTDDDDFVSHLISLWFTWAHPWWQWMDKASFLEAMRSGDPSSPLCTPYLVNMILTDACLLDNMHAGEREPSVQLREQFYAEATRQLEAEQGKVSLAVIQTMGVQWTYLTTNGQDGIGLPVLTQQLSMANDLEKWRSQLEQSQLVSAEVLQKVDQALGRLSWALFALNSFTMLSYPKAILLDAPNSPKPVPDRHLNQPRADTPDALWTPYPGHQKRSATFHTECHFRGLLSLAEIACPDEAILGRQGDPGSSGTMDQFYQRLEELHDWPTTLPDCMQLTDHAVPHVLALHAVHQWTVVTMSKQTAAVEAGQPNKPNIVETPQSRNKRHWQNAAISAATTTAYLMERQRMDWGVDHFPVIIVQPTTLSAFTLLEDLESAGSRAAFISLCITIRAASRRFKVCKGVLWTLQNVAEEKGIALPQETVHLFDEYQREDQSKGSWDGMEDIGLAYLLEKWDDLDLDSAGEEAHSVHGDDME